MPSSDQWKDYVRDADEFFIAYAMTCPCGHLQNHLFLIGHAIELYLKAIYIKQTGDEAKAMRCRHNVKELFEACQENVPPFLPKFEFNGNYEIFKFKGKYQDLQELWATGAAKASWAPFEKEKVLHWLSYQEFYLISENLNNLKRISNIVALASLKRTTLIFSI